MAGCGLAAISSGPPISREETRTTSQGGGKGGGGPKVTTTEYLYFASFAVALCEGPINKAVAADDAAFAFKTGFAGRALMGLIGSDDFSFKVSPDGSTWNTGLTIDRATGRPSLPQGTVLGGLATDPSGRSDGWIWFNATAQRLRGRAAGVDFDLGALAEVGLLNVADNALEAATVIAAPGVVPNSIRAMRDLMFEAFQRSRAD